MLHKENQSWSALENLPVEIIFQILAEVKANPAGLFQLRLASKSLKQITDEYIFKDAKFFIAWLCKRYASKASVPPLKTPGWVLAKLVAAYQQSKACNDLLGKLSALPAPVAAAAASSTGLSAGSGAAILSAEQTWCLALAVENVTQLQLLDLTNANQKFNAEKWCSSFKILDIVLKSGGSINVSHLKKLVFLMLIRCHLLILKHY